MTRYLKFDAGSDLQLQEKVIDYFDRSGFKLVRQTANSLKFKYSSLMLDTWVFNPLKWRSEIEVATNRQTIEATFFIDTSAQIVTAEVKEAWKVFIDYFKQYIVDGTDFKNVTTEAVKRARQSIQKTIAWTVVGIAAGGVIGAYLDRMTGSTFLTYIGLILGANYFLTGKLVANRRKKAL
jgi:uncharacterized membrane protein YraQ (UPF0718 family)